MTKTVVLRQLDYSTFIGHFFQLLPLMSEVPKLQLGSRAPPKFRLTTSRLPKDWT